MRVFTMSCFASEKDLYKAKAEYYEAALTWIAERYDDSKPTIECVMDAYEMSCTARAALNHTLS